MSDLLKVTTQEPHHGLSFGVWLATEGGRKCPQCGRYAKAKELGFIGGRYCAGKIVGHITMYGHLHGFGCNSAQSNRSPPHR